MGLSLSYSKNLYGNKRQVYLCINYFITVFKVIQPGQKVVIK